jgi:phosphohistidine phosphatase
LKNIFLLRHGKSSWSDVNNSDHDRPLSTRGIRDVPIIAKIINTKCPKLDIVLCSSSKRTCETLDLCLPNLSNKPKIKTLSELYLAHSEMILKSINENLPGHKNILVICHNPGLSDFANEINSSAPFSFPTSALCHLIANKPDKSKLEFKDFYLDSLTKPKDI